MKLRDLVANLLVALGLVLLGTAILNLAQQYRASATLAGQETEDGVLLAVTSGHRAGPPLATSRTVQDVSPYNWPAEGPSPEVGPSIDHRTEEEPGGESQAPPPVTEAPYLPSFEDDAVTQARTEVAPAVEASSREPVLRPGPDQASSTDSARGLPEPDPAMPDRIVAPAIDLEAEVVPMGWTVVQRNGQTASEWVIPEYAAGWHVNSALPRTGGNTVLSGHNNVKGEVFRYLSDFELGDDITLYAGDRTFSYVVEEKYIVREKGMPDEVRRRNAQWMMPTEDERLTLISCWPYWTNTHRIIIVARPVQSLEFQASHPPTPEYR
ncbi:MAG: sortase domain-bontaining protein [Anaerolineae bacterium]